MFLALATATIGLASCNGGFKKGDRGMLYNIHVDKSGPKVQLGDFLTVSVIAKDDADSLLFSTYETGGPKPMVYQASPTKGDVMDGIKLLAEGDSATIKVMVDSVYKGRPKPPGFKGKYISYNIKVEKVIAKGKQTDQEFQGVVSAYMKGITDAEKVKEPAKIKNYIADNKLTVTKTASGLNYVVTKPGAGPTPVAGDTVYVNYIGKLTTGKVFETNVKDEAVKAKTFAPGRPYEPIHFPVGAHAVIQGWDEGLLLMNAGEKATFVIPSDLAYAAQGNGPIGPYTPIVFEVELVKIVHPNPNAPKPIAPQMLAPQPVRK
jgi:FKBP-type peptidyl-prolyl cis-trans isomerase FkpA